MITVYFLPVETISGTEQVAGIEHIHDAVLLCTEDPAIRKLIQDTTQDEYDHLYPLAIDAYDASQEEIALYNAQVEIYVPDADTLRAQELLATSPPVITQPEMWELIRIFGRRLGYDF
ncbi:hypothetical protein ES703_66528 [subsurface metagenome]